MAASSPSAGPFRWAAAKACSLSASGSSVRTLAGTRRKPGTNDRELPTDRLSSSAAPSQHDGSLRVTFLGGDPRECLEAHAGDERSFTCRVDCSACSSSRTARSVSPCRHTATPRAHSEYDRYTDSPCASVIARTRS